jgi:FkbM family methyltransferase
MKDVFKKVYSVIPFKKQLFEAVRFFGIPPHSVYKHFHFTGIIKLKVDDGASFKMQHHGMEIENDFFWKGLTGGWEKISMKYWMQLSRNSKTVLDIGANTGVYSLVTKSINRSIKVYAFEPLKQMFKKLLFNNELNNYDIVCVEKAASDKNGKAIIYETGTDHVAAASLNAEIRQYGNLDVETEIEAITLDTFIQANNVGKIDLIKIDVETYEPKVLEGYKKHLPLHRPDFLIEVLNEEVGEKLQQLFEGLDYCYFNIDDKQGKIRKTDTIKKSDYFNYLICTKESAKQLKLI